MMTIFDELKEAYGTNQKAAEAIGLPLRTYMDWKRDSFKRETRREFVYKLIKNHLDSRNGNASSEHEAGQ
jgi:hypothetical protein